MSRPRKASAQLHNESVKLWLTEKQNQSLEALAEKRDIPKGVLAREALLLGLAAYLDSMRDKQAA